jgi:hypothetical protein
MLNLIKRQLLDISHMIDMYQKKHDIAISKVSYMRGLQLYLVTLKKTYEELEDIYFNYALKPQIKLTQPLVISCVLCMQKMMKEQNKFPQFLPH